MSDKTTSKWRSRLLKCCKWSAILAATLVTEQYGTYWLFARSNMPRASVRNLLEYGVLQRSEVVVLDPVLWKKMSIEHQQTLLSEAQRFGARIYYSMNDVPDNDLNIIPTNEDDKKQYEAMKDSPSTVAEAFLRKQTGKVHIFRKRIPIRIGSQ